MNKQENYTIYRISKDIQQDPALLLLTAGTVMSQCHTYFLTITNLTLNEPPGGAATQQIKLTGVISDDKGDIKKEIDAVGVPNQCAGYFIAHFEQYLATQNTELCNDLYRELSGNELLK